MKRSSVALDAVFREHWGRVLATLVGILGDIELAEDAAQEAFATAAERWPRDGEPANPVGWLIIDGTQPRDRPHSPTACPGRENEAARA